ncbi:MAG: hypothetical protein JSS63_13570 [Bacteroidetes bacterium]|nr:hypothetical protein [Bacteroidota bacterium]MBX7046094.1 hypothetical protein [Ignavibacteria bacterium]
MEPKNYFKQFRFSIVKETQLSLSHGSKVFPKPSEKFVPGKFTTDTRRAWLRSESILIPERPEHLV